MRKAVIDLDWLDAEIDTLHEKGATSGISSIDDDDIRFDTLIEVRSKCEPIEQPFILEAKGMITASKEPLPPKCLLDWESAKYCHNNDKCELCKTE